MGNYAAVYAGQPHSLFIFHYAIKKVILHEPQQSDCAFRPICGFKRRTIYIPQKNKNIGRFNNGITKLHLPIMRVMGKTVAALRDTSHEIIGCIAHITAESIKLPELGQENGFAALDFVKQHRRVAWYHLAKPQGKCSRCGFQPHFRLSERLEEQEVLAIGRVLDDLLKVCLVDGILQ